MAYYVTFIRMATIKKKKKSNFYWQEYGKIEMCVLLGELYNVLVAMENNMAVCEKKLKIE